ncbi:MAG: hypothetical protein JNM27_03455 [Leptospirales bacterium]|nr:hypothetical protein [Leptospirales bacterium]
MTTYFTKTVGCYCCGGQVEVRGIASTNSFGFSDLDFRPAEMARSTIATYPQYCPNCHYAWYDLNQGDPASPDAIQTSEYRAFFREGQTSLSDQFAAIASLADLANETSIRIRARHHRIWAADDAKDSQLATTTRLELCELIQKTNYAFEFSFDDSPNPGTETYRISTLLIQIDLVRRARNFETASAFLLNLRSSAGDNRFLTEIAQFLGERISDHDSACYTFGDALGLAERVPQAKDLDPLSDYLLRNHGALLKDVERNALRTIAAGRNQKWWMTSDPAILKLLEAGKPTLASHVEQRLKTEYGISVSRCPKCAAPLRTPTAKQCARCHHSWRPTSHNTM